MHAKELEGRTAALLVLAVMVLCAGLRLWQLDRPPLWEDDYLNLDRALMPVERMAVLQLRQGPADTPYDFQPPLTFALEHLALSLWPDPVAARLVSALAGAFTVLGMFALGRALFGTGPGLLAALLLGLSLFHLDFSRAIKAYAVFFCLSTWSSAFLVRAMTGGRGRDFAAYALSAAGMLYSAYIALPTFVGQGLWAAAAAGLALSRREPAAGTLTLRLACALAAAGLAYLPWLPGVFYLERMFHDPAANPLAHVNPAFWLRLAGEYFLAWVEPPAWFLPAVGGLFAAGVVFALRSGLWRQAAFLLLWAGVPAATVLTSHSVMNKVVSARHLFNLLGPLVLLCAAGAFGLGLLLRRGERTALALGALACLGLSWPALQALPEFYARTLSRDRDVLHWLDTQADRAPALAFEGYKRHTKAFGARFALPGLFDPPGDSAAPAYRRLLVSQTAQRSEPMADFAAGLTPLAVLDDSALGAFRTRTTLLGLLPASPIVVWPGPDDTFAYRADFSSLRVLAQMARSENVTPDPRLACLGPERPSRPGLALYHFTLPEGARLHSARLRIGAALYKRHPASLSDAALTFSAGPDPQRLSPLGTLSQPDFVAPDGRLPLESCPAYDEQIFYASCARTEKTLELPLPEGRELWVAVRFTPGTVEGLLLLSDLELFARADWESPPRTTLAALTLHDAVARAPVLPWEPGGLLAGPGLFAFALEGSRPDAPASVGTPEDLARFRAEHPGLAPVATLPDDQGRPFVAFYDPEPALDTARPAARAASAQAREARSLTLRGKLDVPSLLVDGRRVDIPVSFPRGSTLVLNPGGQGRLFWSPDFSKKVFDKADFTFQDNLRPTPDADYDGGLTCAGDGTQGCALVYSFVSGLPVTEAALEWLPRVSAGPTGREAVIVSLRVDDGPFRVLEHFSPQGPPGWTPLFAPHARRIVFDKPVHHLTLKVELSGEGAQLWAHTRPVDRMWLVAKLDARSLAPFSLPAGVFPLALAEPRANDLTVRFASRPRPFFDRLKYWP